MRVSSVTLPAHWAQALINGDFGGLDDAEACRCSEAIGRLAMDGWTITGVEIDASGEPNKPRFTKFYRLYDNQSETSDGEVLNYATRTLFG